MIHYHGTPIGGTRQDAARFLMGRHALVSFYRPDDMAAVLECCQSFVMDNGAFSHWRAGKGEIDFDAYVAWTLEYHRHPAFDWCLIPDKIDGTEKENADLVRRWQGLMNKPKGVPVWHLHESLDWLEWLVDRFEWVALGSSGQWATPGTPDWWQRMATAMRVICDDQGRPRCKLHGLRMLDPEVFTRLPLSSADSTNAAVNCGSLSRFGSYKPPTAGQRAEVIAARIEQHNSASIWCGHQQNSLTI
ncbi:hypothetical protein GCM10011348_46360 [Marinobacterium nitratireducens]|uniref:Uncharacterized protein n=1 Tax=Marinobacterium nitratireducens TaxID=518897 RepID=A0A917ZRX8_9GAMM|nr:hypothetical protein [Marinobacterium nitratireducens]GGO89190.1 hypothetical protein GCM10011348_46360 [Marinobacterium nitratireducens]